MVSRLLLTTIFDHHLILPIFSSRNRQRFHVSLHSFCIRHFSLQLKCSQQLCSWFEVRKTFHKLQLATFAWNVMLFMLFVVIVNWSSFKLFTRRHIFITMRCGSTFGLRKDSCKVGLGYFPPDRMVSTRLGIELVTKVDHSNYMIYLERSTRRYRQATGIVLWGSRKTYVAYTVQRFHV